MLERQQVAMLNGDVVGYSRLMAVDEGATISLLGANRGAIGVAVVANHGRLVDFVGDNFLAEFSLPVHALRCAIEIQLSTGRRNADVQSDLHMLFRIGLHFGDVTVDEDRLFGNAVNIAARLQSLAEPGGVCLSDAVRSALGNALELDLRDLGFHELKNLPEPVHAFGLSVRNLLGRDATPPESLGGIPTIAVLPFEINGDDPSQRTIADAMTVDVISGLSADRRFSLIAYNSVMNLHDRQRDISQIRTLLQARYVVTGRIRSLGPRLSFSVALVDSETERELWSSRIDRPEEEIFDAFDEIVESIVTALASHLRLSESERFRRRPPGQLDAWALAIQASEIFFLNPTKSLEDSFALAHRALELDPDYAYAWAVLGFLTAFRFPVGLSEDHQADIDESLRLTDRALSLDGRDPYNLVAKAIALQYGGRPGESMQFLQRALRLNPSDVLAHCYYGRGLMFSGQPAIAITHFERFNRLNPNDPGAHMAAMYHAIALAFLERWPESETAARSGIAASGGRNPWCQVFLGIALGGQGKDNEAKESIAALENIAPHWTRQFVDEFMTGCQENHALLAPMFSILDRVWT